MSLLTLSRRTTALSQLQIDVDKDWQGKGIANIRLIAAGMAAGHIIQHNGSVLETLAPGPASSVLTSAGPGQKVVWAPGGTYLIRYFPVSVDIEKNAVRPFSPDRRRDIASPLGAPLGVEGGVNSAWFRRLDPLVGSSVLAAPFSPQQAHQRTPALAGSGIAAESPVGGAVADDGGIQADETAGAKSAILVDQQYAANDDGQQGFGSTSYWDAQTFTTALAQRARGVWLKVFRDNGGSAPGIVSVSLKAVDGSNHPTGVDLCLATIDGNQVPFLGSGNADWLWVPFTSAPWLNNATRYAIVVRCAASGLNWRSDTTSPAYGGGNREYSTNAGTSWTADAAKDYLFKVGYTLDDMTLLPAGPLAVGDAYYWGHDLTFERVLQDVSLPAAGSYALAFEYSLGAGAWASCVDAADGSGRFQVYGLSIISHSPQAGWARDTIAGKDMFWLRARVIDAGAGYAQPKAGYAKISKDY